MRDSKKLSRTKPVPVDHGPVDHGPMTWWPSYFLNSLRRKLDIIKDKKVIAQLTPEDTTTVIEEEDEIKLTFDIETPSSSTKLTR